MASSRFNHFRTLLVLGRVSNLPTVWSNCFAGWLLGGGGHGGIFFWACSGSSFLYIGGMYLNDAFDAAFDRQHRPERPIPSGAISHGEVWLWGLGWLALGLLCLLSLGPSTNALAISLVVCILVYDAIHKIFAFSPVLMAACRFLLILVASSTARSGVTGIAMWSALVLASYIVGLSYIARQESTRGALQYWPCLLLAAPVVLGLVVNRGEYKLRGLALCGVLLLWMLNCLRHVFGSEQRNIGRGVGGLLAGIVLVDLMAVGFGSSATGLMFVGLFVLALVFQRFIPAT
jgi:4-hydroxybenzoate polyprenyltransferase